MKIALVSDIHGNYEGLLKVLSHADKKGVEQIFCLGDIVGYPGTDHRKCLEELVDRDAVIISGNHDAVVTGRQPEEAFSHLPEIHQKALDARKQLQEGDGRCFAWLEDMEPIMAKRLGTCNALLSHGHPLDSYWMYVSTPADVIEAIEMVKGLDLLLCGHTHKAAYGYVARPTKGVMAPLGFFESRMDKLYKSGLNLDFDTKRYMINPGAVGAARDPFARYAILHCDKDATPYRATWHKLTV